METKAYTVAKLSGDNYFLWKIKLQMILQKEKLWAVVTKDPPTPITDEWDLRDQSARATIGLTLEDKVLIGVANCQTAKETWMNLKTKYEHAGLTSKLYLLKKLYSSRYEHFQSMEEYISNIMELNERLRSIGDLVKEQHLIAILLCGLPESYNPIITYLETKDEGELKLEYITERLRDEAIRQENKLDDNNVQDIAMRMERTKFKNPIVCHECGKEGHFRRNCYRLNPIQNNESKSYNPDKEKMRSTTQEKRKPSYYVNRTYDEDQVNHGGEKSDYEEPINLHEEWAMTGMDSLTDEVTHSWVVDSGATTHMTANKDLLYDIEPLDSEVNIMTANGEILQAKYEGKSSLTFNFKAIQSEIILEHVLVVPKLKQNLISVTSLCKMGYTFSFDSKECGIYKEQKVGEGKMIGKTYVIEAKTIYEKSCVCMHQWHDRFGHRDTNSILLMKKENLVKDLKIDACDKHSFCEPCQFGKMTQKPFFTSTNNNHKPFSKLMTDLCGPISPCTVRGYRYFITVTDDATNYTEIGLLKNKQEAGRYVINFIKRGFNQFKHMPSVVRSDGGGEYLGRDLQQFFDLHGIIHQKSVPFTPQQNGKSERKNRTLLNMTRCMMKDTKIPIHLWGEAILTAVYLLNRFTHSKTILTPFEMWFLQKPSIKHLVTFGSKAYAFVPKQQRTKLNDTSIQGHVVGYGINTKAYRIWLPGTSKIINARSVNFDEDTHSRNNNSPTMTMHQPTKEIKIIPDDEYQAEPDIIPNEVPRRSPRVNKGVAAVKWTY